MTGFTGATEEDIDAMIEALERRTRMQYWRRRHPERAAEHRRRWREADPERAREAARLNSARYRERQREKQRLMEWAFRRGSE